MRTQYAIQNVHNPSLWFSSDGRWVPLTEAYKLDSMMSAVIHAMNAGLSLESYTVEAV